MYLTDVKTKSKILNTHLIKNYIAMLKKHISCMSISCFWVKVTTKLKQFLFVLFILELCSFTNNIKYIQGLL